ncbi:AaceriAFL234Cp [[Ashbya] aceris (nom. inval.)]|nr:AaceriAFL234Cp [[Ashbya] aceris (nom. inval.)]
MFYSDVERQPLLRGCADCKWAHGELGGGCTRFRAEKPVHWRIFLYSLGLLYIFTIGRTLAIAYTPAGLEGSYDDGTYFGNSVSAHLGVVVVVLGIVLVLYRIFRAVTFEPDTKSTFSAIGLFAMALGAGLFGMFMVFQWFTVQPPESGPRAVWYSSSDFEPPEIVCDVLFIAVLTLVALALLIMLLLALVTLFQVLLSIWVPIYRFFRSPTSDPRLSTFERLSRYYDEIA